MKIQIFGTKNCTYCTQAKSLLESKNIDFSYEDFMELSIEKQEMIQNELAPTARTFPIILIDDVYIGGFTNLKSAFG